MRSRERVPETGRRLNEYVTVADWPGGRAGAVSLTFDDSSKDHVEYVKPILDRRGFKATFYVVTSFLDSGSHHGATWDDFASLPADGHEIGSHCVNHGHLLELPAGDPCTPGTRHHELSFSRREIERRYPGTRCLTMSYPYAEADAGIEELAGRYYLAARVGDFNPDRPAWNAPAPANWMRIVSHVPRFPERRASPDGDLPELERTERCLDLAAARGEWAVLMIHCVVPFERIAAYGGYETMSAEWLESLCAWMKERADRSALWIDTVARVALYAKERDAAGLGDFSADGHEISFTLTDGLDRAVFDRPLTLRVDPPGDWRNARIVSPGRPEGTSVTVAAGRPIVFDAVPDRGIIRIERIS